MTPNLTSSPKDPLITFTLPIMSQNLSTNTLDALNKPSPLPNTTSDLSIASKTLLSISLTLLSLITLTGNILVIISVIIFRKLHTIPNMFVMSLASADFLMGLLVVPLGSHLLVAGEWKLGQAACTMWTCVDVLSVTASICTLCVIAVDRYYAITMPFKYSRNMTRSRARYVIAAIWIIAIVTAFFPMYQGLWKTGLPEDQICFENPKCCEFRANTGYTILSSLISFYFPLFIMIFSYSIVFKTAIKQRSKIQNSEGIFRRASMPGSRALLWSKREYRAVFTMGIIMGTFVICWLPFFISNIIQVLCNRCIPMTWFSVLNWLGYINSFFNPLIYCHSKEFLQAFKRIFKCGICREGYQQTSRASLSINYTPKSSTRSSFQNHHRISFFQTTASFINSKISTKLTKNSEKNENFIEMSTRKKSYGRYCGDEDERLEDEESP